MLSGAYLDLVRDEITPVRSDMTRAPAQADLGRQLDLRDCLSQQVPEWVQTPVGGPEPGQAEQAGEHASSLGRTADG
jgi:hypothetical protein